MKRFLVSLVWIFVWLVIIAIMTGTMILLIRWIDPQRFYTWAILIVIWASVGPFLSYAFMNIFFWIIGW